MMKFNEYRAMVLPLAERALSGLADGPSDIRDITLALDAGQLLIVRQTPQAEGGLDPYVPVAEGMRTLAVLGRQSNSDNPQLIDAVPAMHDPAGQYRSVYHALALHLHLAAFLRGFDSMSQATWSACEDALEDAIRPSRIATEYYTDQPTPETVDLVLWHALCLLEQAQLMQRDVDMEWVDTVVGQILKKRSAEGGLCRLDPEQSPDSWAYRDLAGLHALANLSLLRRNSAWAKHVQQIALYHQEHTQPDFYTYEPWGLFAFAWSPQTAPFAEQQLHDCRSWLQGGVMGGNVQKKNSIVAGLLLADCANSLNQFESR